MAKPLPRGRDPYRSIVIGAVECAKNKGSPAAVSVEPILEPGQEFSRVANGPPRPLARARVVLGTTTERY